MKLENKDEGKDHGYGRHPKEQPSLKAMIPSLLMVLLLTIALVLVFKGQWRQIVELLDRIPVISILTIIAVGQLYQVFEGMIGKTLLSQKNVDFR